MKRKRYSLKSSVLYLVSGLLHFILMFFGYANEFSGFSVDSTRELYSVYGSIRFGDAAIGSYICGLAEQFGQAGKLTFFATLSTVFILVSTVLAAVMILHGIFGLIKGLAHVDMTPTLRDAAFDSRASLWARLYQISVWASAACLLVACLMNFHKLGNKTCCVLPGLGMILLFLATVVEFILLCVFNKKAAARRRAEASEIGTSECPSCRTHISPGVLFCPVCGVRINAPAAAAKDAETEPAEEALSEPEVNPFPYSKYFGVFSRAMEEIREGAKRRGISRRTVSVLSTLCVIFMILSAVGQVVTTAAMIPEKQITTPMKNDISPLYSEANRETQLLTSGYILSETIPGSVLETIYSLDGKTAMLRSYSDGKYQLYLCRGITLSKVASMSFAGQTLSADGSAVAYVNDDQQLVLYDVDDRDTVAVAAKPFSDFVLSPDGGSVLYRLTGGDTSMLYAYVEGREISVSDNGSPIAISNDGKLIYYYDYNNDTVCVRKANGETVVLAEVEDKNRRLVCYLNEDHDEILFSLANRVYYARKGGAATLLTEKGIETVGDFAYWCRVSGNTLPIDSFAGQYFTDSQCHLYHIGKDDRVTMVSNGVSAFSMAITGDVLYYLTTAKDLYRVESSNVEKKVKMASDVSAYILSPDGQKCYYIDGKNNFWMIKKDCKPRLIATNVLMGTVTREGNALFVIKNAETRKYTLYAAIGVGKLLMIAEDVEIVTATYNRAYYFVAAETDGKYTNYQIYASARGLNFKDVKIIEYAD